MYAIFSTEFWIEIHRASRLRGLTDSELNEISRAASRLKAIEESERIRQNECQTVWDAA